MRTNTCPVLGAVHEFILLGRTSHHAERLSDRGEHAKFALIAEPLDPEIDAIRIRYRQALGRELRSIIEQGIRAGEFPVQDAEVSAACLVGACVECLVGPLSREGLDAGRKGQPIAGSLPAFCRRALGTSAPARPPNLRARPRAV